MRPNAADIVRHFLDYNEVTGSQFDSSCELFENITIEIHNNRQIREKYLRRYEKIQMLNMETHLQYLVLRGLRNHCSNKRIQNLH